MTTENNNSNTTRTTFGEITWDSGGFNDKKATNSKDLFLRLDAGANKVRLVTLPFQYLVHKFNADPTNPKGFGQKVFCSVINGSCPLCDTGDKARTRWLLGVISRKTGTYKILDISYAIFSQIRKLAKNPKKGDPSKYDINIEVDRNGGATGYYSVQSYDKEPLSAADQLIKDNVDFDDLKRRVTPYTPEQVQKRIEKILANVPGGAPVATKTASTAKAAPKVVEMSAEDEELEKAFPSYDDTTA